MKQLIEGKRWVGVRHYWAVLGDGLRCGISGIRRVFLFGISMILVVIGFSQDDKFLPSGGNVEIVKHGHYVLGYSEEHEQAAWVAYELLETEIYGSVSRTDNFRIDPKVQSGSADLLDYRGSGYDRGHLAPAADFSTNKVAMSESFYMSNMSPQEAQFNRAVWKDLEMKVRNWANEKGNVYVVTGPVFLGTVTTIGSNSVTVPSGYYKALLSGGRAIGFIMENRAYTSRNWLDFALTIDQLEQIVGFDFFQGVENENVIESKLDLVYWGMSTSSSQGVALQCNGIAKSTGNRCRIQTTNSNGYCKYHQSQDSGN